MACYDDIPGHPNVVEVAPCGSVYSPELVLVRAAQRLLALTLLEEETLYTSTGTAAPAYVRFNARSVVEDPFLLKSPDSADRKSLENAPPLLVWLVRIRNCSDGARLGCVHRASFYGMLWTLKQHKRAKVAHAKRWQIVLQNHAEGLLGDVINPLGDTYLTCECLSGEHQAKKHCNTGVHRSPHDAGAQPQTT